MIFIFHCTKLSELGKTNYHGGNSGSLKREGVFDLERVGFAVPLSIRNEAVIFGVVL